MSHAQTSTAQPTDDGSSMVQATIRRVAVVAILAVALGLLMQAFILGGKLMAGADFPGLGLAVDLAQGVTWSFLVCAGVSIGTTIARGRAALAGIIAAAFAPIAVALAKASQKVMTGVTKATTSEPILSLTAIGIFRAIEYGILGWVLAVLVHRGEGRALPYIGTGMAVGIVVGGAFIATSHWVAASSGTVVPLPATVAMAVNEVLFPIGCSIVIYLGQMIGRNLKALGVTR